MQDALYKALIILIPSYTVAYLSDKMVWVLPMLVAAGLFATTVIPDTKKRIDDGDTND